MKRNLFFDKIIQVYSTTGGEGKATPFAEMGLILPPY